jgi:hypothetical protein
VRGGSTNPDMASPQYNKSVEDFRNEEYPMLKGMPLLSNIIWFSILTKHTRRRCLS